MSIDSYTDKALYRARLRFLWGKYDFSKGELFVCNIGKTPDQNNILDNSNSIFLTRVKDGNQLRVGTRSENTKPWNFGPLELVEIDPELISTYIIGNDYGLL